MPTHAWLTMIPHRTGTCLVFVVLMIGFFDTSHSWGDQWEHGYAQSGDVKIHYVTAGDGPLVIMIHGFPDYWYTWRRQIPELAKHFKVVAIDQRGYNRSDQPEGVENYSLDLLVQDIVNVAKHFGCEKATLVGHDWGGYVAWTCAMQHPEFVERLVILNAPHPAGLMRELTENPRQRANSQYAREFQKPDAASKLTAEGLAGWVKDAEARKEYVEAFKRSSLEGMLNYYKANYPRVGDDADAAEVTPPTFPKIQCRVLMIHGLADQALLPEGLNDSWKWMDRELTIITVPNANHFVQQDAAELVTSRMVNWLTNTE